MPRTRLLRGQEVFLTHYDATPAEVRRFVAQFRETWRAIPFSDRRRLLAYWRGHVLCGVYGPNIELLADWSTRLENEPTVGAFGQTGLDGCEVRFWLLAVRLLPDEVLREVIAHELMHVWYCAEGTPIGEQDEDFMETALLDWGFGEAALPQWCQAHEAELDALAAEAGQS